MQVALMDEQVVCIAGDASVLMNIQSWAPWLIRVAGESGDRQQPLARHGAPVARSFYDERYSASDMLPGMPDFIALARAFGVDGVHITDRDQLKPQLQQALAAPGPMPTMSMCDAGKLLPDGSSR